MQPIESVDRELEGRIEALGCELVEAEWGGNPGRPILRIRVDLPDSRPGHGVTVADCARVSRGLEVWLDEHPEVPERYLLEVSSPGVERPLLRERDFRRFVGEEVRVKRRRGGMVQGKLDGVEPKEGGAGFRILLGGPEGMVTRIGDDEILRAHLVFDWGSGEE